VGAVGSISLPEYLRLTNSAVVWTSFFRAMWKDFETRFGGMLERLDRHRKYVESCAGAAHFLQSKTLHQNVLDEIRHAQASNLTRHQSTQDVISQAQVKNLVQHQNTRDELAQTQATNLGQHQRTQDGIAQAQASNLAQNQDTQNRIAQAQAASLGQHQSTQDELARVHASHLDYIQAYNADMRQLKSSAQDAQVEAQQHTADLVRIETHNVTRHQVYLEDISKLANKLDDILVQEQSKKLCTVKDWLAVGHQNSEFHASYRQIRRDYPTTTQWVLQHEAVRHWLTANPPATPILWINGIPGAGMFNHSSV
jgi:hypothetical protein